MNGSNAARRAGQRLVDRAKNRNAFNGEWLDLITRNPGGPLDPGRLNNRTRARPGDGHHDRAGKKFKLHVRGALTTGGFTADDIKEIILQQSACCVGRPRLQVAEEMLKELGKLS